MDYPYRSPHDERVDVEWLQALNPCPSGRIRSMVERGGEPIFFLAPESTFMQPVWVMLIKQADGNLLRVTSNTDVLARRLTSVRQVYQVARTCGFCSLTIPVENRR